MDNQETTAGIAPVATHTAASTATVTLDEPIARGDQVIATIILRRPKSGELRGIDLAALTQKADYAAMETLLPRISTPTLTRADIANLDPSDFVQLAAEVVLFFAPRTAVEALSPTA
jgi:hypothetical protein